MVALGVGGKHGHLSTTGNVDYIRVQCRNTISRSAKPKVRSGHIPFLLCGQQGFTYVSMERVSIIASYEVDVWFCELRNSLIYHNPRMVEFQARDNHRLPSISAILTASGTLTLEAPDFICRFIKCELCYPPFIS